MTEVGSFSESPLPVPLGEQKMSPAAGTSGVVGTVTLPVVETVVAPVLLAVTLTVVLVVVVVLLTAVVAVVTMGSEVLSVKPPPMAMTVGL